MPQKHNGYLVTNASIYTVRPVVTEHRMQVIEEATPPRKESTLEKVIGWVIGVPVGLWVGHWIVGLWCHCY